jgi:uncharacterized protein YdbL (DUF1318 family)
MRSRIFLVVAACLVGLALGAFSPAAASPLDDAKAAGQVGEQPDGYLGVVPGAPASAEALVREINTKRRAHYQEIAAKNGTEPAAVAALAGQKLVARTPPGQYYKDAAGNWVKR